MSNEPSDGKFGGEECSTSRRWHHTHFLSSESPSGYLSPRDRMKVLSFTSRAASLVEDVELPMVVESRVE